MDADDRVDSEEALEEALEETFPASDAPANTAETGIHVDADPLIESGLVVRDNRPASRFEVAIDGQVAFLEYSRGRDGIVLLHTEVPESARRRGIGTLLARTALRAVRAEGLRVVVRCPFVRAHLRKEREQDAARHP
jgi:predicted GNAT family acetyltransferase